ncbi:hypothetical protein HII12_000759 [Brettanomyces bruxellensis]|uniref:Uncharacterized protein n=1 Tax=Dekkera bruxellensis TaxID=5007 RepID=A0A8H6BPP7_DEKBR|nr:hypothetical protein HII12_000759 [Brettanomyces bruxellensis]
MSGKVKTVEDGNLPASVYLDSIRNGARVINGKLLSKGYFSTKVDRLQKLLFLSTDYDVLMNDKENASDPHLGPKVYENDRNIINIIYSMLDAIEVSVLYKESVLKQKSDKEAEVTELKGKVRQMEDRLNLKEKGLLAFGRDALKSKLQIEELQKRVKDLIEKNGELERSLVTYSSDAERKLRRSHMEIERLSERLSNRTRRIQDFDRQYRGYEPERKRKHSDQNNDDNDAATLAEHADMLGNELLRLLCFCQKAVDFLQRYNDSTLDLRFSTIGTHEDLQLPKTFIPTEQDLLKFDSRKCDLAVLDQRFVTLLRQLENEKSDDTFRFRRGGKEQQLLKENAILRKKLADKDKEIANLKKLVPHTDEKAMSRTMSLP